jgi:hypothetical protein
MTDDLLGRIKREMHQRMEQLRDAVDEQDRLQADLTALKAGLSWETSPWVTHLERRDSDEPLSSALESELPSSKVIPLRPEVDVPRSAAASAPSLPRLVSPKVIKLMSGQGSISRPVVARQKRRGKFTREKPSDLNAATELYERAS